MKEAIIIEKLQINEIKLVSNIVNHIFEEFVINDYSDYGKRMFKYYIEPANILDRFLKNNCQYFVAKCNNEIIGVLEVNNCINISLLYVKKEFHRKGIGKKLFEYYLCELEQEEIPIKIIIVDSSVYAEDYFIKLGFNKIDELKEEGGKKYIPMLYKL